MRAHWVRGRHRADKRPVPVRPATEATAKDGPTGSPRALLALSWEERGIHTEQHSRPWKDKFLEDQDKQHNVSGGFPFPCCFPCHNIPTTNVGGNKTSSQKSEAGMVPPLLWPREPDPGRTTVTGAVQQQCPPPERALNFESWVDVPRHRPTSPTSVGHLMLVVKSKQFLMCLQLK